MAYLNIRDRVIEAKIAYVGPELAGKSTTFDRLMRTALEGRAGTVQTVSVDGGQVLSLDWRSTRRADDEYPVLAKLMTTDGPVSSRVVDDVLAEADGIVVVLDAEASALARNRSTMAQVRGALARASRRRPPVHLQINKCDSPRATPTNELLSELDLESWPWVGTSATRGDGVHEALSGVVTSILASIKEPLPMPEVTMPTTSTTVDNAAFMPRGEGNPLLGALKQVIQSAIAEQMAGLEDRLVQRIETRIAASRSAVHEIVQGEVRALEARLSSPRAAETQDDERAIVWGIAHLGERLDAVLALLQPLADTAGQFQTKAVEGLARIERHSTEVRAGLDTLFDEFRRSRKRWFT